ncbi:hypothetical protein B0H34DRAFT_675989 [Crassisporium funariophilum]|nr:hypothetical protein B0H34DRAFT_675989 [Crassisporium funariophilum]
MRYFSHSVLVLTTLLSVTLSSWNVVKWVSYQRIRSKGSSSSLKQKYSYIGDDFPFYHPSVPMKPTTMTLQESTRYGYNITDHDGVNSWYTLIDQPGGYGRAHLGLQKRSFLFTFYHQLHCVAQFSRALHNRNDKIATPYHVNHCIQYLRQTLLCTATDTLEEGDFLERNFATDRVGPEVSCQNWESIFGEVSKGWNSFAEWRESWN